MNKKTETLLEEYIRLMVEKTLNENTITHITLSGNEVDSESKEALDDLHRRLKDAEYHRNKCDHGSANRVHYNGLLSMIRKKIKKHPLYVKQ